MKTSVCHWDQFTGRLANLKIAKQTFGISTSGAPSLNGCNIWKKYITDHLGRKMDTSSINQKKKKQIKKNQNQNKKNRLHNAIKIYVDDFFLSKMEVLDCWCINFGALSMISYTV